MSAQNQELVELTSRICRLEAQNRRLRSTIAAALTTVGLLFVTGLYLSSSRGLMAAGVSPATQPAIAPILTARELRIVDEYGRARARLGISATGDGRLMLMDHQGRALFDAPNDRNALHVIPVQR